MSARAERAMVAAQERLDFARQTMGEECEHLRNVAEQLRDEVASLAPEGDAELERAQRLLAAAAAILQKRAEVCQ